MNIQAHPEGLLTPDQFDELRASLNSERQQLAGSITALNALIEANRDCEIRDSENVARVLMMSVFRLTNKRFATAPQEIRGRACIIAKHHRTKIVEIDAALGRLDQFEYGKCGNSGKRIAFA